ncbi:MAG: hypothetical protein AAGE90_07005 [Pseudomonadota bacterium]
MEVDREALQLIAATATLTGSHGWKEPTEKMMDAMFAARPADPDALAMVASIQLMLNDVEGAKKRIADHVMPIAPEHSFAKAVLVMIHHSKDEKAERDALCKAIIAADDDPDAVTVAKEVMGS